MNAIENGGHSRVFSDIVRHALLWLQERVRDGSGEEGWVLYWNPKEKRENGYMIRASEDQKHAGKKSAYLLGQAELERTQCLKWEDKRKWYENIQKDLERHKVRKREAKRKENDRDIEREKKINNGKKCDGKSIREVRVRGWPIESRTHIKVKNESSGGKQRKRRSSESWSRVEGEGPREM